MKILSREQLRTVIETVETVVVLFHATDDEKSYDQMRQAYSTLKVMGITEGNFFMGVCENERVRECPLPEVVKWINGQEQGKLIDYISPMALVKFVNE